MPRRTPVEPKGARGSAAVALAVRLAVAATLALATFATTAPAAPAEMRRFAATLAEVLPLVVLDSQFERPGARETLKDGIITLTKAAHTVKAGMAKVDDDPVIPYLSGKFERSLKRAGRLLAAGRDNEARALVRQATTYCISCHTRAAGGGASFTIATPKGWKALSSLERADFYAATRQFEDAMVNYEAVLDDKAYARRAPHRWEAGAKRLLAIVIRVQGEPRLALEILSRIRDEKAAPAGLYRDALGWRQAVKQWVEEAESKAPPAGDGVAAARVLVQQGEALIGKGASPDAGLVQFLRASAMLHERLRTRAEGDAVYQEGLFLAGRAAEHLASLNLWTLHEEYYEACIRYRPHTDLARRCLERFRATQPVEAAPVGNKPAWSEEVADRISELSALAR